MKIKYTVTLLNPNAHIFKVILEIVHPEKNGQILSLPAWIPGSYMIRDFARNIIQLKAKSNNKDLKVNKLDKDTWQAEATDAALLLKYEVYAWDLSVRSAHFDMTHAFFNGTSLFLMPHGFENEPASVLIEQPTDLKYKDWHLTTSLTPKNIDKSGFGHYQSSDYEDLIDHPVEIGIHSEFTFEIENTPHKMTFTGLHRADVKRLKQDLTKICHEHCQLFGELPDLTQYIFMVMVTDDGYGGLEHKSSTSLICSRDDLPLTSHAEDPDDKYRNFLGLCSHEYFHTWNVKRIKPEAYLPYNLSSEVYTKQLWAFEGITSYYDELALIRSGVISLPSYLELIGQTITRVLRSQGRQIQSLAESSFDTWTKFYKQDESAANTIVSYYAKGALFALCLDLTIRNATLNNKSLDDVMRYLWQHHGKKNIGVPEGKIESIASQIAGINLKLFFAEYLYGVTELPLEPLLKEYGINLKLRPTLSVDDKGGKEADTKNPVSFGARFDVDNLGAKITQVFTHGSAELAGLAAGDIVIAINKIHVSKSTIEKILETYQAEDVLKIHAFRRDELLEFDLILQTAELTTCYLVLDENTDSFSVTRRKNWLITKHE